MDESKISMIPSLGLSRVEGMKLNLGKKVLGISIALVRNSHLALIANLPGGGWV